MVLDGKVGLLSYSIQHTDSEYSAGLCHLKEQQDRTLPLEQYYIRYIAEIPLDSLASHDEDDAEPHDEEQKLRIVICMNPASSRRLARAQYLQSDITFKQVAGFLEFEIGGLDDNARIGNSLIIFE